MGDVGDNLSKLSRGTKALVIVNEFTTRRMEAADLAVVLQRLAPDIQEQAAIVDLVENELLAASYPRQTIEQLMHTLMPSRRQMGPASPPPAALRTATRRVHSPFVVPFEDFKFGGQDQTTAKQPGPAGAGGAPGRTASFSPPASAAATKSQPAAPKAAKDAQQVKLPPIGHVPGTVPAPPRGPGAGAAPPAPPKPAAKRKPTSARHPEAQKAPVTMSFQKDDEVFFGGTTAGMNVGEVQRAVKPSILIADDDSRIRMIYKIKMEEAGYHVIEAGDGIQAWKYIRDGSVMGVVLDMKIPGYHGLEILSRMIDAQIFLPVVISSAYDQLGDEFVVATYPKLKYLVKPVPPEEVVNAMNELMAAEQAQEV